MTEQTVLKDDSPFCRFRNALGLALSVILLLSLRGVRWLLPPANGNHCRAIKRLVASPCARLGDRARSKGRLVVLSIFVVALVQACNGMDQEQPDSWIGLERVVLHHPSGLELELPESIYHVEQTADGFRIQPKEAVSRRSPVEIRIQVEATAQPDGDWPQSRQLRGRDFRYRIDIEDGGSGGQVQVLRAWESRGDVHVSLEHMAQAEAPAQPDFTEGWAILAFSRYP